MGAAVAHGYLHRLPARCRATNGNSLESTLWAVHPGAKDAMRDLPHPPGVTPKDAVPQTTTDPNKALPGGMEREPSSDSQDSFQPPDPQQQVSE